MSRKKEILILSFILLIGILVRFTNLTDNFFFGYDQARDVQRIHDIVYEKDIKLVGPETDIPGVFNGSLLYYLLLPAYLLTNFNPNSASALLLLINALGIIIVYYGGRELFNSKVGLLAGFLWAISYQQANYGRYISNTGLMPVFATLFFVGLGIWYVKKKDIGLILSVIGLSFSIHVGFYFIYLTLFYILLWRKTNLKTILISGLTALLLLLPFAIAELKFGFLTTRSLFGYFSGQSNLENPLSTIITYLGSINTSLYYSFFSFNAFFLFLFFSGALVFVYINYRKTNQGKFLTIWALSTLPLFAFKSGVLTGQSGQSSMIGAATIIFALAIYMLLKSKKPVLGIIVLFLILASNLSLFFKEQFKNSKLFSYQPITYRDEKELIDYTYNSSNDKFSVCALTNPFFINTLWSSLYKIYGEKKFGYLPFWSGQKQYLNKTFLEYDKNHVNTRYLIIEPPSGISPQSKMLTIYLEDRVSKLVEEKKFGSLIIQKRQLLQGEKPLSTQKLTTEEINNINYINERDPRYSCFNSY